MQSRRHRFLILLAIGLGIAVLWRSALRRPGKSANVSVSILNVSYDPHAFNGVGMEDGGCRAVIGVTNQGWSNLAKFGISTLEVRQGPDWVPWPSELDGRELGSDWGIQFGTVYPTGLAWPTNLPPGQPVRLKLWAVREVNHLFYFLNYHTGREIFHRGPQLTGYSSEWVTREPDRR